MAPNAKTDAIFAYCVLQVGTTKASADHTWPQKCIWWVIGFSQILSFL